MRREPIIVLALGKPALFTGDLFSGERVTGNCCSPQRGHRTEAIRLVLISVKVLRNAKEMMQQA